MKRKFIYSRVSVFIAFIIAMSPILEPYVFLELGNNTIRIMDVLLVIAIISLIITKKINKLPYLHLISFLIFYLIINIISFMPGEQDRNFIMSLKVLLLWFIYALSLGYLWKFVSQQKFIKYTKMMAIIVTTFLIIQFVFVSMGYINFFDGRIPFLKLYEYDGWASIIDPNTGDIRVHSFFQESSYYGIFILPVFTYSLMKNNFKLTIFLFFGLFITSSLLAILGSLLILSYYMFIYKHKNKSINKHSKKNFIYIIFFTLFFMLILYNLSDGVRDVINTIIFRVGNIGDDLRGERLGSTKVRLLGYSSYFKYYPIYFKIFGSGASQFTNFLGLDVVAYSSTVVTVLLNYGIIGLLFFVSWVGYLYIKSDSTGKIFVVLFLIISFVDSFWFGWKFYYILTWIFIFFPHRKPM